MKESNQPIRIKASWDHSEVPTGVSNQRGLLLEDVHVLVDGARQGKELRPKTCELIQSIGNTFQ
jgi:hypothetical protein